LRKISFVSYAMTRRGGGCLKGGRDRREKSREVKRE
jgi:hypothetical protein